MERARFRRWVVCVLLVAGASQVSVRYVAAAPRVEGAAADLDGDGLPDEWESRYGLNPASADGLDGADGDPDGDGRTNLQEFQESTHPRGFVTRYLAEGATGSFFKTTIALFNPGTAPAAVLLRFLKDDGTHATFDSTVPAGARRTVVVSDVAGMASASFSTIIESDQQVVVDRRMTWGDDDYGSHAETAITTFARRWYLAEGSTSGDFNLFYLLQNPQATTVDVTVRYLRSAGLPPIDKTYTLPPISRTTIYVDLEAPELASTDLSAVITASQPIIVERSMYLNRPGQPFAAGHDAAGVTDSALTWFLAEGATGPFFDLFVLIENPSDQDAAISVDYLLLDGTKLTKAYTVGANSRFTIWVDDEELPAGSGHKPLANVAVSTIVRATNAVPVIVERAMWWPGPEVSADYWYEAHDSPGATVTGTRWAMADGEVGGPHGLQTYVLVANLSDQPGTAQVAAHFDDATSAVKTYNLPAHSRTNVSMGDEFPATRDRKFGVTVESLGASSVPLVVERSVYGNAGNQVWASGSNALATRLSTDVNAVYVNPADPRIAQTVAPDGTTIDIYGVKDASGLATAIDYFRVVQTDGQVLRVTATPGQTQLVTASGLRVDVLTNDPAHLRIRATTPAGVVLAETDLGPIAAGVRAPATTRTSARMVTASVDETPIRHDVTVNVTDCHGDAVTGANVGVSLSSGGWIDLPYTGQGAAYRASVPAAPDPDAGNRMIEECERGLEVAGVSAVFEACDALAVGSTATEGVDEMRLKQILTALAQAGIVIDSAWGVELLEAAPEIVEALAAVCVGVSASKATCLAEGPLVDLGEQIKFGNLYLQPFASVPNQRVPVQTAGDPRRSTSPESFFWALSVPCTSQCRSYAPTVTGFPYSMLTSGSATITTTTPSGTNSFTQPYTQSILFGSPVDEAGVVFGASAPDAFQNCDGVFQPKSGSLTQQAGIFHTTTSITSSGGVMSIQEVGDNTAPANDGNCPDSCLTDAIHYTKTWQYTLATGAYTLAFVSDRHIISFNTGTSTRIESVSHNSGSATGQLTVPTQGGQIH